MDTINLFLTPLLVLFLICLYISSRALSKAFEHRNFVARYQRETNHITVEKSCVPGNYGRKLTILVETFIYIINKIKSSKRENDLRTLQFLTFFFFYLKSSSTGGVVGWCEGAVYLTSPGRPTDIGLQLGKACYPCSG